jgi:hypothetical protein
MEIAANALLLLIGFICGYGARAWVSRSRRAEARRYRARKARFYMTLEVPRHTERPNGRDFV